MYNTEVVYTTTLDGVSETVDERGEDYYNGVLEQRDDGDFRKQTTYYTSVHNG